MTIDELYSHLFQTGYRSLLRRFDSGFSLLDYDIKRENFLVRICERERGRIIHRYLETPDEAAACAHYLSWVSSQFQYLLGGANERFIRSQHSFWRTRG